MPAARFRKKPEYVEAITVHEVLESANDDWDNLPAWLVEHYEAGKVLFLPDAVEIRTLNGDLRAVDGDWIVKGDGGEPYPVHPDAFASMYDPA